ncbi:MAG: hypothetical protein A3F41_02180 [Coxiella sp. RIFCSPHIGHO2_12_FULL_44_14]|nr:MAG: hypothetical protein A3F41_02180 [Coxiella sp. RIFCSPHIGHO2_12_FULL_44_14]
MLSYVALIHKAKKKSTLYGVMFPDFPGCVFAGHSVDEAVHNAREGLVFHMEGLLDAGDTIPEPTSLEEVLANPEYKEATPCLIHIAPPTGHLKRINVSMDMGLLVEIDHAAKLVGKNRSEFLAYAARQLLA